MPIDTAPLPPFPADTPPQYSDTGVCPYCIICFLNPRIRFEITEGPQILCTETACPTTHTHRCLLQFTYLLLLLASAALAYMHIFPAVYQPDLVVLGYAYNLGYTEKVAYCLVPKFAILSERSNFVCVAERRELQTPWTLSDTM